MSRPVQAALALSVVVLVSGCAIGARGNEPVVTTRSPGVIPCEDRGLSPADERDCLYYTSGDQALMSDGSVAEAPTPRSFGFEEQPATDDSEAPTPRLFGVDPQPAGESSEGNTRPEGAWSCWYDPTMDYDWHNDVLCSDGVITERPYLLEDDSYVTEAEIRDAAASYEDVLNGT